MAQITLWMEGYAVTGNYSEAQRLGTYEAVDLDDACEQYKRRHPDSTIVKDNRGWNIWACKIYDNEADARKAFG